MQTIPVSEGQTSLDIAMQGCGDVSASFDIALLNGLSITDDLVIGSELILPAVINPSIVQVFTQRYLVPVSAESFDTGVEITEGIEFWTIESDFIIS